MWQCVRVCVCVCEKMDKILQSEYREMDKEKDNTEDGRISMEEDSEG